MSMSRSRRQGDDVAMITTVESLQHRTTLKQLDFWLCATSPLQELAEEIRKHNDFGAVVHQVSVAVVVKGQDPNWSSPDAVSFFGALGELASLRSISLHGLGTPMHPFPLARLTLLLAHIQRSRSLRMLQVKGIQFADQQQSPRDTIEFVASFVHLKRLRHLEWEERIAAGRTSVLRQNFDIWNVILRQPQLDTLCLKQQQQQHDHDHDNHHHSGNTMGHIITRDSAEKLCGSLRIEELIILNFSISAHALLGMAEKLAWNRNLRVLNLDLRYTATPGVMALWDMFRTNQSITTTELWIPSNGQATAWKETQCLSHLASCLSSNTILLVMVLKGGDHRGSSSWTDKNTATMTIPTPSPHSTTIVTDDDAKAFVSMLEANPFGPITLHLDGYAGKYAPLIQLHTYLNVERKTDSHLTIAASEVTHTIWNWLLLTAVTAEKPVSSLYRFNALFSILQQYPTVTAHWQWDTDTCI
jgi:hypothetical protein